MGIREWDMDRIRSVYVWPVEQVAVRKQLQSESTPVQLPEPSLTAVPAGAQVKQLTTVLTSVQVGRAGDMVISSSIHLIS